MSDHAARSPWPAARMRRDPLVRRLSETELVDRDAELTVLSDAWSVARSGRTRVVVVEAEPGMGKSALLEEFVGRHPGSPTRWLRCDEFEREVAFAGVERLVGPELPHWSAALAAASEVDVGRRVLAWLGDQQPAANVLVLAIDDAQWLDRSSARALAFALRRLSADRVLAVVMRRPGGDQLPAVLTEHPAGTTLLRLGPLSEQAAATLARRWRTWSLAPGAAQRLIDRTHGVPLLVAEAIRGAATPEDLTAPQRVPSTVAGAVQRMLALVDDDTRALVEAAAVLAEPVEPVVLALLTPLADAMPAIAAGLTAGLLRLDVDGSVECAHDLLAEAVYRGMSLPRRRQLHRRAADQTTGDRSLAHRAAACSQPDPELVTQLNAAAEAARAAQQYGLAAAHRLRARGVCSDAAWRDQLLLEALVDRVCAQDLKGAHELAVRVDRGAGGALSNLALGLLARETGQVEAARRLLRRAHDGAIADHDVALCARAGLARAVLAVRLNEGQEAVDAVTWAEQAADAETATDARTNKALGLWQLGAHDQALAVLDDALSATGDAPWDAEVLAVRGMVRQYLGQLSEAVVDYDAAIALEPVWRPTTNYSRTRALRAKTRMLLGDWDGASIDAAAARTLAREAAQAWSLPLAYAVSADVPAWRGQFDIAEAYLAEADDALRELRPPQLIDFVLGRRLELAAARGDHDQVVERLSGLAQSDYWERVGTIRDHRWPYQCWISARIELGDLVGAEQTLADYERALDRWPGGSVPPRLGWLRGQLAEARGEPLLARDHYTADLVCAQTARMPYAHAELLLAAGHLERVLGNRREALDQLTRAHRMFARLRATPAERRCAAELAACGLQARSADPLRLTPREEDVAALVARGYTNREIAAELYLTVKTVEYHLGNIFAKLGIANRRELRRLRQAGPGIAATPSPMAQ